ncbi:DsbA family oxidoreductase [Hymenobacter busanensis]|uniref:DsbA family oxidoreductase n=1 Tax=Hymenobacter busanensis TaxID=2607656 RepID=A0A7L4ZX97_9BACT|nr:DsbA family oxidoreductase [Hymenobacter busanensis]KAA9333459.1 DsbA family oxidoreductase [Hymenobacter busanensis]QHJ07858.1 thioredoxin domain-containing protein [Hymenobacter busanensis]
MKVEIWSDIVCPFCYIGKRKFENALAQFAHRDDVEIVWRSFELDPEAKTQAAGNLNERLAAKYGRSVKWAKQMSDNMTQTAAEVGLHFDFDKAIPANTFRAHRLVHLAAQHGLQDAAKERLFKAYMEDGLNVDDVPTLQRLGTELGLPAEGVTRVLTSDEFAQDVRHDEYQARQIGVRGVPYFVFADKYAVSGAQPTELFQEVLEKVWDEFNPKPALQEISPAGGSCTVDGVCD